MNLSVSTSLPQTKEWRPPRQGDWTYADYVRLPDNGMRYEVKEFPIYWLRCCRRVAG